MQAMREIKQLWQENEGWPEQCHVASLALVRSGLLAPARVARGGCKGVGAQHSWVVLGDDCYDVEATIVDPTLWSYDDSVEGIWVGTMREHKRHRPHGMGSIFAWGRPDPAAQTGEIIDIEPECGWSSEASAFIEMLGPLDYEGWRVLAHAPVQSWPSAEILGALHARFPVLVPIDVIGMLTDLNPNGLYLLDEACAR